MAAVRRTVTIVGVQYMSSNKDGNPRFRVTTNQGTWTTAPGASVGRAIENSEYQGEVIVTIDGGNIVGVSTVDGTITAGRQS